MLDKTHPYDELGQVFWEIFPTGLSNDDFEAKLKSFSYSLRMFWLQRPDKLFSDYFPVYILVTNTCHESKMKKPLSKTFKPLLDATPIMSDYSHYDLVEDCVDSVRKYYYQKQPELRPELKRKWWQFWNL